MFDLPFPFPSFPRAFSSIALIGKSLLRVIVLPDLRKGPSPFSLPGESLLVQHDGVCCLSSSSSSIPYPSCMPPSSLPPSLPSVSSGSTEERKDRGRRRRKERSVRANSFSTSLPPFSLLPAGSSLCIMQGFMMTEDKFTVAVVMCCVLATAVYLWLAVGQCVNISRRSFQQRRFPPSLPPPFPFLPVFCQSSICSFCSSYTLRRRRCFKGTAAAHKLSVSPDRKSHSSFGVIPAQERAGGPKKGPLSLSNGEEETLRRAAAVNKGQLPVLPFSPERKRERRARIRRPGRLSNRLLLPVFVRPCLKRDTSSRLSSPPLPLHLSSLSPPPLCLSVRPLGAARGLFLPPPPCRIRNWRSWVNSHTRRRLGRWGG